VPYNVGVAMTARLLRLAVVRRAVAVGAALVGSAAPSVGPDLASAFHAAPLGIVVCEPGGRVVHANPAVGALLGRQREALVGTTLFALTHEDDLPGAVSACRELSAGRTELATLECRLLRPDGEVRWAVVTTSLVRDAAGAPAHLVMHLQDVTQRRVLEAELVHRTLHDPLTGLPNRTLFADRLEQTIASCGRDGGTFLLLFLDVDRFKQVNDAHGHDVGDAVLVGLADRLRAALRPGDTAARLAGDEFLVLCPGVGAEAAAELTERLRTAVGRPVQALGQEVAVSVTVGAATGDASSRPEDVLRSADQHMYRSKGA
jgi:diguanylate cyclase (GGDEF)-like protein/PAS domain S-box-containing protein